MGLKIVSGNGLKNELEKWVFCGVEVDEVCENESFRVVGIVSCESK